MRIATYFIQGVWFVLLVTLLAISLRAQDPLPKKADPIPITPTPSPEAKVFGELVVGRAVSSSDSQRLVWPSMAVDSVKRLAVDPGMNDGDAKGFYAELSRQEDGLRGMMSLAEDVNNYRPAAAKYLPLADKIAGAIDGLGYVFPGSTRVHIGKGLARLLKEGVGAVGEVDTLWNSHDARGEAWQVKSQKKWEVRLGSSSITRLYDLSKENTPRGRIAGEIVDKLRVEAGIPRNASIEQMVEASAAWMGDPELLRLGRVAVPLIQKRAQGKDVAKEDLEKLRESSKNYSRSKLDQIRGPNRLHFQKGDPKKPLKRGPKSPEELERQSQTDYATVQGLNLAATLVGMVDKDAAKAAKLVAGFASAAFAAKSQIQKFAGNIAGGAAVAGPWGAVAGLFATCMELALSALSGPDPNEILLKEFREFVAEYRMDIAQIKESLNRTEYKLGDGIDAIFKQFEKIAVLNAENTVELKAEIAALSGQLSGVGIEIGLLRLELMERFDQLGTMEARRLEKLFRGRATAGLLLDNNLQGHERLLKEHCRTYYTTAMEPANVDLVGTRVWPGDVEQGLLEAASIQPLGARPWDESRFVNTALKHFGRPASAVTNLPNFVRFANAYADVALAYPETFAAANLSTETGTLLASANELHRGLARPVGQKGDPVLAGLTDEYLKQWTAIRKSLADSHAEFQGRPGKAPCFGLDPLSKPAQNVEGGFGVIRMKKAEKHVWHDGKEQKVPESLLEHKLTDGQAKKLEAALPPEVRAALRLGLASLDLTWYEGSWGGDDPFDRGTWTDGGLDHRLTIDGKGFRRLGNNVDYFDFKRWQFYGIPALKVRLGLKMTPVGGRGEEVFVLADRVVFANVKEPIKFARRDESSSLTPPLRRGEVQNRLEIDPKSKEPVAVNIDTQECDGVTRRQEGVKLADELDKRLKDLVQQFADSPFEDKFPEVVQRHRAKQPEPTQGYWRDLTTRERQRRAVAVAEADKLVQARLKEMKPTLADSQRGTLQGDKPAAAACKRLTGCKRLIEAHLLMTYPRSAVFDHKLRAALVGLPDGDSLLSEAKKDVFKLYRDPAESLDGTAKMSLGAVVEFAAGEREPEHHAALEAVIDKLLEAQVVEGLLGPGRKK